MYNNPIYNTSCMAMVDIHDENIKRLTWNAHKLHDRISCGKKISYSFQLHALVVMPVMLVNLENVENVLTRFLFYDRSASNLPL